MSSTTTRRVPLPIDTLIPGILRALHAHRNLVLEAAPGAGKTTRVPPALLDLVPGEILVLEPRRLAARLAARRVASELGEPVGETVGYQVRFEEVAGPRTRLRFVTEGILTRRFLSDPTLQGVDLVILDEFHERHLDTDLALALLRRLQRTTRPQLKLLVMSATLDATPVARFLGDESAQPCPILRSEGRLFAITIDHLPYSPAPLERQVRDAVERLIQAGETGHILVFLPGLAEIRRAERECGPTARAAGRLVFPLHGDLTPEEQDRAVSPVTEPKLTKLILATNVAESSITIDGVTAVIDSGLARTAGTSPPSLGGMPGLPTLTVGRISRASARQRAGRAGRTCPGRVLRLYPEADFLQRPEHDAPEITRTDLAQLCLTFRAMGIAPRSQIDWLDAPPAAAIQAAEALLDRLGASTPAAARALARYPLPPRLARMLQEAIARGAADAGCRAAALLSAGSRSAAFLSAGSRSPQTDILAALDQPLDPRTQQQLQQLRRLIKSSPRPQTPLSPLQHPETPSVPPEHPQTPSFRPENPQTPSFSPEHPQTPSFRPERSGAEKPLYSPPPISPESISPESISPESISPESKRSKEAADEPLLIALLTGFPDRVARRRKDNTVQLASGRSAELQGTPPAYDFLLVLEAQDLPDRPDGNALPLVRLTARCSPDWLLDLFPERLREDTTLDWNRQGERVESVSTLRYDELVLEESRNTRPNPEAAAAFLAAKALEGNAAQATDRFLERFLDPKDREALADLLARLRFAGLTPPEDPAAPAESPPTAAGQAIAATLRQLCLGLYSFADLRAASANFLPVFEQSIQAADGGMARLRELAPATLKLPSGRQVAVHYEVGKPPWIASRLQDFFGLYETPRIGPARTPVVAQLLAPNHRPVQTTDDLAGFWQRLYPQVRRELSRRYPRHQWPEKP